MFSNSLFQIFASQQRTGTLFPGGTALNFYRDFVNDKQLNAPESGWRIGPDISFTRNSFGTFFDSVSGLQTASNNQPRFNYSTQGNYLGLLIEGETTNLVTHSSTFTNSSWFKPTNSVVLQANATTAPDGTNTATLLRGTTTNTYHVIIWDGTPTPYLGSPQEEQLSDFYDRSIFIKQGNKRYAALALSPLPLVAYDQTTIIFDFETEDFVPKESQISYKVYKLKNGWYRVALNRKSSNSGTNRLTVGVSDGPLYTDTLFADNPGEPSELYIWGAQAELGQGTTSYIPTNGAEVTRAADNATVSGKQFSLIYNQLSGTYFTRVSKETANVGVYTSFTNTLGTKFWALSAADKNSLTVSGVSSILGNIEITPQTEYKIAVGLTTNNFVIYENNTFVKELTSGIMPQTPAGPSQFELGRFLNSNYLNGHILEFGYWPTKLNNTLLANISPNSGL
jgi:hypothetical protein